MQMSTEMMATRDAADMPLEEAKKIIRSVLISSPITLNVKQVERDVYSLVGANINYINLGYSTFFNFLIGLRDVCRVQGGNDASLVMPIIEDHLCELNSLICTSKPNPKNRGMIRFGGVFNLLKKDVEGNLLKEEEVKKCEGSYMLKSKNIPSYVKKNIKILLNENPKGIWMCLFLNKYRYRFKSILNLPLYGYAILLQFLSDLEEEVVLIRPVEFRSDYILFSKDVELPDPDTLPHWPKCCGVKELTEYRTKSEPTFKFPTYVVLPDFKLTKQLIVSPFTVGVRFDVFVSEVFTPNLFYAQLFRQQFYIKMQNKELAKFYSNHGNMFEIPADKVIEGLVCVAPCKDEHDYQRACVLKLIKDGLVRVMFVDTGVIKHVAVEKIMMLHKSYSDLSQQAFPLSLFDVCCQGLKWPEENINFFWEYVKEKHLRAEYKRNGLGDMCEVELFEVQKNKPLISINEIMIENNKAFRKDKIHPKLVAFQYITANKCKDSQFGISS